MTKAMLKAGTYWIGDLCYVLHEVWDEVCERVIEGDRVLEGKFGLADGREFVMFNTAWGDGVYNDGNLNDYPVDSGNIGAILLSDIRQEGENDISLGHVHTFDVDFQCENTGGDMCFHNVYIYTSGSDEDEDDDYDYYEDEDEEDFLIDEA